MAPESHVVRVKIMEKRGRVAKEVAMADTSKHLEKWFAYIESHTKRIKQKRREGASAGPAITLSRETGAGAITLAERLAEYLNSRSDEVEPAWMVFDKNLITVVLKEHGLPEHLVQFMPEDKPKLVEDAIGDMLGIHPPNFKLVQNIGETIYRVAAMGRCIIVGRGANIITQDLPNVLHLRLVGSLEARVKRCMDFYKITESEARRLITKQDRARKRYLLAYYDCEIEDPMNYHMVINVDRFRTERLLEIIGELVEVGISSKN
jgi:cytidylate kinase